MRNEAVNQKTVGISSFLIALILLLTVGCGSGGSSGGGTVCTDADSDSYFAESGCATDVDCNDGNAAINPGAAEICGDGIDNDCDGNIDCADDDCTGETACYISATLENLTVSSSHVSIPAGHSTNLTAKGLYSDNSIVDLTNTVTWSVSDELLAEITSTSVLTGITTGDVIVTACYNEICEYVSVKISDAVLEAIEVSAENSAFPEGWNIQFVATGIFSDGVKLDISDEVTWSSSDNNVAEPVAGSSVFETKTTGSFTATAEETLGSVSGSNRITVTSAVLSNIFITPSDTNMVVGERLELTATGVYSDNTLLDLTEDVTWISSATVIATISEGFMTAVSVGGVQISVELNSITANADFTVTNETIESIAITPGTVSLAQGTTIQLKATALFSDNSTKDITSDVIWVSSDTSIVTVDNSDTSQGLLITVSEGTATVQACLYGVCSEISVSVSSAVLESITISRDDNDLLPQQSFVYFTATGHFSNGSNQDMTNSVAWSTDSNNIAVISNQEGFNGLLFALANGEAQVKAVFGDKEAYENITVSDISLTGFKVTPVVTPSYLPLVIDTESTVNLTLYGVYSDASEYDFSPITTWSSLSKGIVSISNEDCEKGSVTPISTGNGTVIAVVGNLGIMRTISVLKPVISLTINSISYNSDAGAVIVEEDTGALVTAEATFFDSTTGDVTNLVTWTSAETGIASFPFPNAPYGGVSGVSTGDTTLNAALNIFNTAEIAVNQNVAVVELESVVRMLITETSVSNVVQLYAVGSFTSGTTTVEVVINNERVTWSSSESSDVISISNDIGSEGVGTVIAAGESNITAEVDGFSLTELLTIN